MSEDEWAFVRGRPLIGERILGSAPRCGRRPRRSFRFDHSAGTELGSPRRARRRPASTGPGSSASVTPRRDDLDRPHSKALTREEALRELSAARDASSTTAWSRHRAMQSDLLRARPAPNDVTFARVEIVGRFPRTHHWPGFLTCSLSPCMRVDSACPHEPLAGGGSAARGGWAEPQKQLRLRGGAVTATGTGWAGPSTRLLGFLTSGSTLSATGNSAASHGPPAGRR